MLYGLVSFVSLLDFVWGRKAKSERDEVTVLNMAFNTCIDCTSALVAGIVFLFL